jgi:hypothetical protein
MCVDLAIRFPRGLLFAFGGDLGYQSRSPRTIGGTPERYQLYEALCIRIVKLKS